MFVFRSLASGSSGNAYLLRTEKVALLFDAGLRLPRLVAHLRAEGLSPDRLSAILISHEHRDHCCGAPELASAFGVPVYADVDVLGATGLHGRREGRVLDLSSPAVFGDVEVRCFPVEHDAIRPVGFAIRVQKRTIAIATDLGQPTPEVANAVSGADLVVLEANHDLNMLNHGRYPHHLRRRVAGPTGHLSNAQAAGILSRHVRDERTEVWLAHLSKENNSPALALRTIRTHLNGAGLRSMSIQVAQRDRPSARWTGQLRPTQLSLFPGLDTAAGG